MTRSVRERSRAGFTLIELLVVIAIIAILAGLGTMAIMRVLGTGPDAADTADIKTLEEGLGKFHAQYKCYPPDYVKLCHYFDDYNPTNPLDAESVQIISKIWPQVFKWAKNAGTAGHGPIPWAGYDSTWNVRPLPSHPVTGQRCVILQGDQCLVLFLGGPLGLKGFTESAVYPIHDPNNPNFTAGKSTRVVFYEFPASRLRARTTQAPPTNGMMPYMPYADPTAGFPDPCPFPSFFDSQKTMEDANKKPFVYFSSNTSPGSKRGYNYAFGRAIVELGGVQPYFEAFDAKGNPLRYLNPETFQIIAAGRDAKFGPIGQWYNGASGVNNSDWRDNRANFSVGILAAAKD